MVFGSKIVPGERTLFAPILQLSPIKGLEYCLAN